jgi:hypothetical protein
MQSVFLNKKGSACTVEPALAATCIQQPRVLNSQFEYVLN